MPGKRNGNPDLRVAMAESELHSASRALVNHDATCFECSASKACGAREVLVRTALQFVIRLGEALRDRDAERIRKERKAGQL